MKKRRNTTLLMLPLMLSLCAGNMHAHQDNNTNGFIVGACAIGGALLAAAGIAAAVEYCWSETDEQAINRIDRKCRDIHAQYKDDMGYFYNLSGIHPLSKKAYQVRDISEMVLYEFATHVWERNISQHNYRSGVRSAKSELQSCVQDLRKRIHSLERKSCTYEEQKQLTTMRKLLNSAENLQLDVGLFAECLEFHRTYFDLYESVGNTRNRYLPLINMVTSGRYNYPAEVKHFVIVNDGSQYAFKNFVKTLESDIANLSSYIRSLAHNYDSGRSYAYTLVSNLTEIKNIIVSDPRYQQELYAYEQARLERQRIQMLEEQARLERDRIDLMNRQNRILEERNRIERQKMYAQPAYVEEVTVTVSF